MRRGQHHTKNAKRKMSISKKGKVPWNKGLTMSVEYRQMLSIAHKGIVQKGQFQKGCIPWVKDKHHSEETKKKIGLGNKGHFHSKSTRIKISKNAKGKTLGRILSQETRLKISQSRIGMQFTEQHRKNLSKAGKIRVGRLASNWQGGIGKLPYSQDWTETLRKSIRQRDNYICQLCGKTQKQNERKLDVHHIDYDKENCNPENLVSLCRSCNAKVNGKRKYWTEFFRLKLKIA